MAALPVRRDVDALLPGFPGGFSWYRNQPPPEDQDDRQQHDPERDERCAGVDGGGDRARRRPSAPSRRRRQARPKLVALLDRRAAGSACRRVHPPRTSCLRRRTGSRAARDTTATSRSPPPGRPSAGAPRRHLASRIPRSAITVVSRSSWVSTVDSPPARARSASTSSRTAWAAGPTPPRATAGGRRRCGRRQPPPPPSGSPTVDGRIAAALDDRVGRGHPAVGIGDREIRRAEVDAQDPSHALLVRRQTAARLTARWLPGARGRAPRRPGPRCCRRPRRPRRSWPCPPSALAAVRDVGRRDAPLTRSLVTATASPAFF